MTLVDRQVDVWTSDFQRRSLNRITDSPSWDAYPLWQPGMRWMAFASMRDGVASIYRQELSTGAVEKLVVTNRPAYPNSWSSDGKLLAYHQEDPQTGEDIWIYSAETRTTTAFLRTPYNERHADFSPDGRFVAYESDEGGEQMEVYRAPVPSGHSSDEDLIERRHVAAVGPGRTGTVLQNRRRGHGGPRDPHAGVRGSTAS